MEYKNETSKFASQLANDVAYALRYGDDESARLQVSVLSPEDKAELFNLLPHAKREQLTKILSEDFDCAILPLLSHDAADEVLQSLGRKKCAQAIAQLETKDAIHVIAELDNIGQKEILDNLGENIRQEMQELLAYPEGSAGRMMRKQMVYVPESWTIGEVIDYLRDKNDLPKDFYVIFVVSPQFKLLGQLLLANILHNRRDVFVRDIMQTELHPQLVATTREEINYVFRKYGLVESPVIDGNERLVGSITVDDVVIAMQEETEEAFLHAGGVGSQDIHASIPEVVRNRFPWLFVNLMTAVAAAFVVDIFKLTIERVVLLAVLMPIIASTGANVGIQASAVSVRAIATRRIRMDRIPALLLKEMFVGCINGIGIAIITASSILLLFHDEKLAAIFATAMVVNMMVAGLTGVGLPLLMMRLKLDPAISSGVFLTMFTDIVGFFALLGLASLIL